jgi:hypothetical protein
VQRLERGEEGVGRKSLDGLLGTTEPVQEHEVGAVAACEAGLVDLEGLGGL